MGIRSFLRWFFAPDPNNAHIGPPGAQGMVVVNGGPAQINTVPRPERIRHEPMKTTGQIRAEQEPLPPRTWTIVEGHGIKIGEAVEEESKKILVTWTWKDCPSRRQWVDFDAFEDDMTSRGCDSFAERARITPPIRVRFHPRTDGERTLEKLNNEDFDG